MASAEGKKSELDWGKADAAWAIGITAAVRKKLRRENTLPNTVTSYKACREKSLLLAGVVLLKICGERVLLHAVL